MSRRNQGLLDAADVASLGAVPRFGIVDSYDPDRHRAKVVLQPSADGKTPLTGYMPVLVQYMGNGWGVVTPLQQGDQVAVLFMQDHGDAGVIVGRLYDAGHAPPNRADGQPAMAGEVLLVHQSGSRMQLTNDRKVLINGALEIDLAAPTITLTATTSVAVTAPAITIGSSGESLQTLMTQTAKTILATHTHGGVQTGAGTSGPMTQTFPGNSLTTALTAG
jgi:hypothetical protein